MKRVLINVVLLAWLAGATAWASNIYSVNYEGSDLPESEAGWHRAYGGGGAIRSIETDPDDPNNRFLLINSLASPEIFDYAYYSRQMDPGGPSERWCAEWRILIRESHYDDQGVGFTSDHANQISFSFGYDYIYDIFNHWSTPVVPGLSHTYRLESSDMAYYDLFIDGQLVRHAAWFEGLGSPTADFGDISQYGGTRSAVSWDYFRFGVYAVPEPGGIGLIVAVSVCGGRRRRSG